MQNEEKWVSPRAIAEAERVRRVIAFDAIVDLALDGVIDMDEALAGFRTELGVEQDV